MKTRRGAFLGFGNVAEHGHLPAWRERGGVTIVAVADSDAARRARAAELLPQARVYADATELLGRERLDFVDINTPPATHVPLITAAARHGCHVLCEKPLTTSVEQYQIAVDAVRAAGVTLFTVHNWKHSTPFGRLTSLVSEGKIGRLRHVRMESIRNGPSVTVGQYWRNQAAIAGGGILVDHGWHALYLLTALAAEEPLRIGAVVEKRRYTESDVEDTATCNIEFPSISAEIFLTWAGTERRTRWKVTGELGSVEIEEQELRVIHDGRHESHLLPESLSAGSHHPDWFAPVIEEFLDNVDARSRGSGNLAEAQRCLTLLTLAYQSAARGGEALPVPARPTGCEAPGK
jgi:predicted dehydrogenase